MNEPAALHACVLYAEDDENDAFLMRHAWRKAHLTLTLHIVSDGQHAIDYLSGIGEYADRARYPLPRLVLLDLNLPRRSGLEVLEWVRERRPYDGLAVSILSSSNQRKDMERAKALGADAYFVKPANVAQLVELVGTLQLRWLAAPG